MMKKVQHVYIFDGENNPIFIRDNHLQGANEANHDLVMRLINVLQSFATQLGEGDLQGVELGDGKIFLLRDELTKLSFIVACSKDARDKRMKQLLHDTKDLFHEHFKGDGNGDEDVRKEKSMAFVEALNELLEPHEHVENFLRTL